VRSSSNCAHFFRGTVAKAWWTLPGLLDGTGLAVKTVRHVHGIVHIAFETALK
jgi:hypothetical protein